ncbi:MAG: phosphotransferase [Anaerolineaceae bacterium]|jgi:5-methylthioribose kinase
MNTEATVEKQLQALLGNIPGFYVDSQPERLSGGLLNYVWRITGKTGSTYPSLIAKWAPPYIASNPQIELDPRRLIVEANALKAFGKDGPLSHLADDNVRLPEFVWLDKTDNILVMEDVCDCPDLAEWIQYQHESSLTLEIGKRLGQFIASLHLHSANSTEFMSMLSNPRIQNTRLEVLYRNVKWYAEKAHLPEDEKIGNIALEYGNLLQLPGKVIIMGDLWLPSIIVSGGKLRIIDWELAHYGHPSQDVGYLAAHLWMHIHRPPTQYTPDNARLILKGFFESYRNTLGENFSIIFGKDGLRESSIHFGSELLARTVGLFQSGYLYQGLEWDHPDVQFATKTAARHILNPEEENTFEILKL